MIEMLSFGDRPDELTSVCSSRVLSSARAHFAADRCFDSSFPGKFWCALARQFAWDIRRSSPVRIAARHDAASRPFATPTLERARRRPPLCVHSPVINSRVARQFWEWTSCGTCARVSCTSRTMASFVRETRLSTRARHRVA